MAAGTFAIVGPGGVGGLLGAVLTKAGRRVVYVARPATAEALTANGIHLASPLYGDFQVPATAVSRLTEPVQACLVAVKATGLDAALDGVPDLGDALVVPLLNGLDHMAVLRSRYPAGQVVAGTIRVESTRVRDGSVRIEHTSPFCWLELASATAPPDRVEALATDLREAGLDVTVRADETVLLWDKLALLAPMAVLTTHASASIGTVRAERRADLEAVVHETAAVAKAAGAPQDPAAILAMVDRVPPAMKSSMLRDAEAGRPTEWDAIGGAVLRAAQRYGIETPVLARLVSDLRRR